MNPSNAWKGKLEAAGFFAIQIHRQKLCSTMLQHSRVIDGTDFTLGVVAYFSLRGKLFNL